MIQSILELFTTVEKAEAMLESPMIKLIFTSLFILFIVTLIVHIMLYVRINRIRNHLKHTGRMDIEPLLQMKTEFDVRKAEESLQVETFVQEQISGWRMFHVPVVSFIKLVHMTISVFILLGVLGTFIGLTISLGSINGVEDQLIENVSGVLSGIDVAFYTSIIGMSFSLIMTVLVKVLNTEYVLTDVMLVLESQLEGAEGQDMRQMVEVSESIRDSIQDLQRTNQASLQAVVESFTGFKDYTAGLEKSAKDLALFNDGLSENLDNFQELFHQMKVVTDGFSDGTVQLNKNFDALFSYFKKSDRRNERFVETFEKTAGKVEEVSQAQIDSLSGFDDTADELKHFTSSLVEEQGEVHTALAAITAETKVLIDNIATHNDTFTHVFGSGLDKELSGIRHVVGELQASFEKVGRPIASLPEALEIVNQTQVEQQDLLADRFAELKEFNRTFANHINNHATESQALETRVKDTSVTFDDMGRNNTQLIQEIKETMNHLGHHFTQREQQVESSVEMVKSTLSNYVATLEGTLGSKLDGVIRKIEDSMQASSNELSRGFSDMRRQAEETKQNHARQSEQLIGGLSQEIQLLNRQLEQIARQAQTVQTNRRLGTDHNAY